MLVVVKERGQDKQTNKQASHHRNCVVVAILLPRSERRRQPRRPRLEVSALPQHLLVGLVEEGDAQRVVTFPLSMDATGSVERTAARYIMMMI